MLLVQSISRPASMRWFTLDAVGQSQQGVRLRVFLVAILLFLTATGVRLLHWQDARPDIENGRMRFGMSDLYKADALHLLSGDLALFIKGPAPPSDADIMTHPPGYSLLLALIFKFFGDSTTAWRLVQLLLDSLTVVGIFFLARELLPIGAAITASILSSLSPQLAQNAIVLLPDSVSVLPIVWALFFLVRAYKTPRILPIIAAGALLGVSCWLRPNALLLSPFLALLVVLIFQRRRWRYATVLVAATLVVIAPVTIRNLIVFRTLAPVSLGVGHNLSAGIADYDYQNRFGLISKDHLMTAWEAEHYGRPDYAHSLFAPDGIARDRDRLTRGWKVVRTHPLWFASVMLRRMSFMTTSEPMPVVSRRPTITHSLATVGSSAPAWSSTPNEMLTTARSQVTAAKFELTGNEQALIISNVESTSKTVPVSQAIRLTSGRDYVLQIPVDLRDGQIVIRITGANQQLLGSAAVPDALQGFPEDRPPTNLVGVPFVNTGEQIQISITVADASRARLGRMEIFDLGESSLVWTRVPRLFLRGVQKLFVTPKILICVFLGILIVLFSFGWRSSGILLAVPLYYLLLQSPLHTEHRYVLAVQYFFLIFASVPLYWIIIKLSQVSKLFSSRSRKWGQTRDSQT